MSIELKFFFKNFTANNQAGRLKANNAYLRKGGMVLRRYVIMQGGTFWLDSVSDTAKPECRRPLWTTAFWFCAM